MEIVKKEVSNWGVGQERLPRRGDIRKWVLRIYRRSLGGQVGKCISGIIHDGPLGLFGVVKGQGGRELPAGD